VSEKTAHRVKVGLISDTHGALDPRVFPALEGVDFVLHAGDIGAPDVLWQLEGIAPVTAVLGNTDYEIPGYRLEKRAGVKIGAKHFLIVHDIARLGQIPEGVDVVVHGHTHVPAIEDGGEVLIVNPGPARRPTGGLSRTVGLVTIDGEAVSAEIVSLDRFGPKR
jgi:putative phosphoesterase